MSRPYVLWLEWQGFYADESIEEPQIVVRDRTVLDANQLARQAGIQSGMSVSEARNIAPKLRRTPWREELFVERQRAWLDLCLGTTGRIEPIDGHIAALDLSAHPRPYEMAAMLTEQLVDRVRLPLRFGAGPSKWVAKLASCKHDLVRANEDPAAFLSPLNTERLLPVSEAALARLAFLGYRKVGEIANLPIARLREQFGEEAHRILLAATGAWSDPVRACYPDDSVRSVVTFDGSPETLEIVENGLLKIAEELADGLIVRQSVGKRVELLFEFSEGKARIEKRIFTKPLSTSAELMGAFRLMSKKLSGPSLERVSVVLGDLRKARRVQLDIADARAQTDRQESVGVAVQNVRTAFGERAVLVGSQIREPRWQRVRRAYRDAYGWAWV